MDWLAFKTHPSQINQDAFAQAMLRHMVQLQVGKELSDAEYNTAVEIAIREYGLNEHGGAVDLRGRSAGSISAIAGQISEVLQHQSNMVPEKRGTPA
jgi:hypothetical protein